MEQPASKFDWKTIGPLRVVGSGACGGVGSGIASLSGFRQAKAVRMRKMHHGRQACGSRNMENGFKK